MISYFASSQFYKSSTTYPKKTLVWISSPLYLFPVLQLILLLVHDAERQLNESKIHEHIRDMLKHLRNEDELWLNSHIQKNDDEVRDHPCLEVFLQNHVMEELCRRAKKDRPR